ncbi:MAG: hypothetical protein HW408_976 [Actinobacteria bacterium]|nr:hypothetical protein [Actinomycetota bacterium]
MRRISEAVRTAACVTALMLMALPAFTSAAEKGHDSMPGMKHGETGHGTMPGMKAEEHAKMGDKIFGGKVGPWSGEARLIDMKASIEKAKASGMKMEGTMKSHHFELFLADPKTKKAVTEGKGTVTVIGPDKKEEKSDFMVMEGHFGADVNLPKPGKYTFKVAIESGKEKGSATFSHKVK